MSSAGSFDIADRVLLRENVTQFLAREARLLDEGKEEEWYDTVDDDYELFIPIRQATEPRSNEIDRSAYRTKETKAHVRIRLDRLASGMAYSEVPPSRTMRLVGSIDIEGTDHPDVVAVRSAVLLYRQRGIDPHFDLLPYRRYDTLRSTAEGLRLLSREIILTEVSLATPNLGLFL